MRKISYYIPIGILLLGIYPVNVEAGIFKAVGSVIGSVGSFIGIGGGSKTHLDFSKKDTDLQNVKTGINDNKTAIEGLSRNRISMEDIEKLIDMKIVGYDRSQKAGRDIIQIKKNDAFMIMYIVGGIFAFAGLVVTGLITTIGLLIKKIFKTIKERAETELKQTRLWLENMTKSKEEYKKIVQKNGFATKEVKEE